jgi:hypothetical protein
VILDFGKHRGSHVRDVPTGYLQWLLYGGKFTFRNQWMKEQVQAEYDRRVRREDDRGGGAGQPTSGLTAEQIEAAYRSTARRWHPDRGGSTEAMQALADYRDMLLSLASTETF